MDQSIQIAEQRIVHFYDDELIAVRTDSNDVYVSVRHLCDSLGLDRASQVRRIKRNDVLAEGYTGGVIMTPPAKTGGGGRQKAGLLRVALIPLWLSGVQVKSVRPDLQPKIKQYQQEAAKVLWDAFRDGRLSLDNTFDDLLKTDSPSVQAYKMIMAMAKMAQQQILLEAQLQESRGDITENRDRIEALEAKLSDPNHLISAEQAMHLSQAVKSVALALGKQSGKNEFQGVYGELYRRFKIPSYRELPANKYEEAMGFMRQWYESLSGSEAVPF